MRVTSIITVSIISLMLLSGCWIDMPASAPPAAVGHTGDVATINRDLMMVNVYEANEAWDDVSHLGPNQHIVGKLPAGSQVDVVGFVSRRTPAPDLHYYYVCYLKTPDQKFFLPLEEEKDVTFARPPESRKAS